LPCCTWQNYPPNEDNAMLYSPYDSGLRLLLSKMVDMAIMGWCRNKRPNRGMKKSM